MAIFGATRSFDSGSDTTTFTWTVCGNLSPCTIPDFQPLDFFTVDVSGLGACGGTTLQPGTTASCTIKSLFPPCSSNLVFVCGIGVDSGQCQDVTLVLAGDRAIANVDVGTHAAGFCPLTLVPGPVCPTPTPTP